MEDYVFKKNRSLEYTLKKIYSHIYTDIAPAVLGIMLIFVAYSEYVEFSSPNVAIWYLIAGMAVILYVFYRLWKMYKGVTAPHLTSFIINEKGVYLDYNKYPYEAEARWEEIEYIEYFPGEVDEGLNSTIEHLDYTDICGAFKDSRGVTFKHITRIINDDWKNEQGETLFAVLLKFEKSKDKCSIK